MRKDNIILALALTSAAFTADAKLKTTWDVGDYVQEGLIAHYDGIRNMGADLPHDSTATTWSNLVSGTSGTANLWKTKGISADQDPDYGSWFDKGYEFKGYSYFFTEDTLELGSSFTVQVAGDFDTTDFGDGVHTFHRIWTSVDGGGTIAMWLDRSYQGAIDENKLFFAANKYKGDSARPQFIWSGRYATVAFDETYAYITEKPYFITDEWGYRREITELTPVPALQYGWGGKYVSNNSPAYCCKGKFFAWRAYSRKLTDAELAWNMAIDEIRFHGESATPVTNVVIAADDLGRCGVEPPGNYVVDGSHEFKAVAVSVQGGLYEPYGHTIETFDAETGSWGDAEFREGASVTVSPDSLFSSEKVRIAWKWRFVSGVERFDAHHCVQEGLIAHYDGIRNTGADRPHDPNSEIWVDLAGESRAILHATASGDPGAWTDRGYDFKGYSYFETEDEILELGSNFTVQITADIDSSDFGDGIHTYHNVWSSRNGSCGLFLDRSSASGISGSNLTFKVDAYNADGKSTNRPNITKWDGKYATYAFNDEFTHAYATEWPYWWKTAQWGRQRAHTVLKGVPAMKYAWGGRYASNNTATYCCKGLFYSWRAYSRMLTDAELAWNRDVDEVRYRGGDPVFISNAVVVATAKAGFAASESGAYLLVGAHSFTAERMHMDGTTFAPHHRVESWNAEAGAWEKVLSSSGGTCTLRQSDGTAPRRIVWSWHKEGLSFIVR